MKNRFNILSLAALFVAALGNALKLNAAPVPALAGEDYAVINTTTAAVLVASNPKLRQELWTKSVVLGAAPSIQECPFADGFVGRVTDSKKPNPAMLRRAVTEIMDTQKVAGNTINITTQAGIGGEGVAGEGRRQGSEVDLVMGTFPVTIGKHFFSVGVKQNAIDETTLNLVGPWEQRVNEGLRFRHSKLKNDSIIMRMIQATTTTNGAANLVFPSGVSGRSTLKSAHVIDTTLISELGEILPGMGAMPMDYTSDEVGSLGELFVLMSPDKALTQLATEPAMLSALQYGWERGKGNPIFKGGFTKWNGHGIYRWIHRDHAARYEIGSPLLPRAKLGVALTGANTGSAIIGGGNVYRAGDESATYGPNWFKFFSNAPFTMYGDINSIAASTGTTRYVMIIHPNRTSWGVYSYTVNTGKQITIAARVPLGLANETSTHNWPVGSIVVECNVLGTPFARSLFLGAQAVAAGIGSINGSPTAPEIGRREVKREDYGNDIGVGVEAVWGCAAVQRAGDSAYPNFLVVEHAVNVPGAPTIS